MRRWAWKAFDSHERGSLYNRWERMREQGCGSGAVFRTGTTFSGHAGQAQMDKTTRQECGEGATMDALGVSSRCRATTGPGTKDYRKLGATKD